MDSAPPEPAADGTRPGTAAGASLTVLSYNIHHGEGADGLPSLRRIAEEVRASGADLVGLQEVDRHFGPRSGFRDQAAELGGLLSLRAVHAAHLVHPPQLPGHPQREYGNALLTRFPILESRCVPLPGGRVGAEPGEEPRGYQEALLDLGGGRLLRHFTTHLEVGSAETRLRQAEVLAAAVAAAREPAVLTADLNALPSDPALGPLRTVLTDCHQAAHGTPEGGETFHLEPPPVRIDYVMVRGLEVLGCEVPVTEGSDHRPVLVRLALPA